MGIINPDLFVFNNGIEKANTYISFANEQLHLTQDVPMYPTQVIINSSNRKYRIHGNYNIYWSKEARFAGKQAIQSGYINTIFEDPIPVNIYEYLYSILKTSTFPNAVDSLPNTIEQPEPTPVPETTS